MGNVQRVLGKNELQPKKIGVQPETKKPSSQAISPLPSSKFPSQPPQEGHARNKKGISLLPPSKCPSQLPQEGHTKKEKGISLLPPSKCPSQLSPEGHTRKEKVISLLPPFRITNSRLYVFNDKIYDPWGNLFSVRINNKKNMRDGHKHFGTYVEHGVIFSPQVGSLLMDCHIHQRALELVKRGWDPVVAHHSEAHEASHSGGKGYPPTVRTLRVRWHVVDGIIVGEDQKPYNSEKQSYCDEGSPKKAFVKNGVIHDVLCEDDKTNCLIKQLTFKYINEGKEPIQARQQVMHM